MRIILSSLLFTCLCGIQAFAAGAPASGQNCAELERQFDYGNRIIAGIQAEGVGDDSAPRETTRQLRETNERLDQLTVVEFMRMRNCPVPAKSAPVLYMGNALACQTDKLKGNYQSDTCDISKWMPITSK